ncbi:MAG: acyltransferase [Weeksellaceae bacterium]
MNHLTKITLKDKLDFLLFGWIINWAYPQYVRPKYGYIRYYRLFFEYWIPQKIFRINGSTPWPVHYTSKVRGAEKIQKGIFCDPGDGIGNYIQAANGIIFGDNIEVSPGVKIISANHNVNVHELHDPAPPIVIGSHTMIYANAVILPGVQIGENVIIGAGSVVTKNIPSNSVAVGNPCKVIKTIEPNPENIYNIEWNKNNRQRLSK